MKYGRSIAALAALACAASFAISAKAGGDLIKFPEDYAKGVLYTTVDRADNKQFRELYVSPPAAIEAAKKGRAAAERHGAHAGAVRRQARRQRQSREGSPTAASSRTSCSATP